MVSNQFSKKSFKSLSKINEIKNEFLKKKTETTIKSGGKNDIFNSTKKTIAENPLFLKSPEKIFSINGSYTHKWKVFEKIEKKLSNNFFQISSNQKKIKLINSVNAHLDSIRKIEFINQNTLLTFSEDSLIKTWDLTNKNKKKPKPTTTSRHHSHPILSSFTTKTHTFSGDSSGILNCYKNPKPEKPLTLQRSFKTGHEPVWDIDFNEKTRLILTSNTNRIKIWNIDQLNSKKEKLQIFSRKKIYGPTKWYDQTTFLASCFTTQTLKNSFFLYDLEKDKEKLSISQNSQSSNFFKISGNLIFSADEDSKISVYDLRSAELVKMFTAHSDSVLCLDLCEKENVLVSGGCDSSLRLWDLREWRCLHELSVHRQKFDDSIFDVRLVKGGCVTAGADGCFKVFKF